MTLEAHDMLRLVEAMIFASTRPISEREIVRTLDEQGALPAEGGSTLVRELLASVQGLYRGRGVELVEVAGGWQFRTAQDLAPALTRVVVRPRQLPRAAMETLAIIAYHQPCTRTDIETIRGVALNQKILETLLEAELIVSRGRKEVPGRPVLWGTSPVFLEKFGLRDLRDLPQREELFSDVAEIAGPPRAPGQAEAPLVE